MDRDVVAPPQGFDRTVNVVLVIALAVVITVRPRELNFLRLLPFLLPLLALALLFASRTAAGLRSVCVPFPVLVLVMYAATTMVWSGALVLSVAESLVIFSLGAIASLVASFCSLREMVAGVLAGCLAVLVASAAVGVVLPGYGLVPDGYQAGSLRGIMLDRNSLSFVLLIGLIATIAFEFRGNSARKQKLGLCAVFFGGVLWTTSSTCLILSVVAVLMAGQLGLLRRVPTSRRGRTTAGAAIATSLVALYINAHFDEVLTLVDRDPSLTGRTRIWPAVENLISQHPWLGQGWGAVWGNESIRLQLARSIGFDVPHSHNGYLDVQVQVGAVGLGLLLTILLLIGVRGLSYFLRSDSSLSSWPLLLALILILYNQVETSFSAPSTMFLMFTTLVALTRLQDPRRREVTRGERGKTPPSY